MIGIRKLPCDAGQKVLSTVLWKKSLQSFSCSPNDSHLLQGENTSWNKFNNYIRSNFHTAGVDRDLGENLKCLGGPIAALGAIGSGMGLGILGHGFSMAVARNPSIEQLIFPKLILIISCCEMLGLFCCIIPILYKLM